jgi:hypothetical protein
MAPAKLGLIKSLADFRTNRNGKLAKPLQTNPPIQRIGFLSATI